MFQKVSDIYLQEGIVEAVIELLHPLHLGVPLLVVLSSVPFIMIWRHERSLQ